jgi:hypothetical protein
VRLAGKATVTWLTTEPILRSADVRVFCAGHAEDEYTTAEEKSSSSPVGLVVGHNECVVSFGRRNVARLMNPGADTSRLGAGET